MTEPFSIFELAPGDSSTSGGGSTTAPTVAPARPIGPTTTLAGGISAREISVGDVGSGSGTSNLEHSAGGGMGMGEMGGAFGGGNSGQQHQQGGIAGAYGYGGASY